MAGSEGRGWEFNGPGPLQLQAPIPRWHVFWPQFPHPPSEGIDPTASWSLMLWVHKPWVVCAHHAHASPHSRDRTWGSLIRDALIALIFPRMILLVKANALLLFSHLSYPKLRKLRVANACLHHLGFLGQYNFMDYTESLTPIMIWHFLAFCHLSTILRLPFAASVAPHYCQRCVVPFWALQICLWQIWVPTETPGPQGNRNQGLGAGHNLFPQTW